MRVVRCIKSRYLSYTVGNLYNFEEVGGGLYDVYAERRATALRFDSREFNTLFQEVKPMKEQGGPISYQFGVSRDSLINLVEIEKNLTRKHPIAIVSYMATTSAPGKLVTTQDTDGVTDGQEVREMVTRNVKMVTMILHESIWEKVEQLDGRSKEVKDFYAAWKPFQRSMYSADGAGGFVDVRTGVLGPALKAVKAIRAARIKTASKPLEVTVEMLEI